MLYIDENLWGFDLGAALDQISEQRREQALRFSHEQGRRQCVLAYQLLKRGLREVYGITEDPLFDYGEHGKPTIVGRPDIGFSLSHCREAVACVVGPGEVGVDVETVGRYKERLVDYTMSEAEAALIRQADKPAVEFARLWTMKEARLKLTGEGITRDLRPVLADAASFRFSTVVDRRERYVYTVCRRA